MTIGTASSPTGIPLGSTEITSAGVSPAPTGLAGSISIPATSSSTACSTVATSPTAMFGSSAMYDGGGTTPGASTPATAVDPGTLAVPGMATPSNAGTLTSPAMATSSGMLNTSGSRECAAPAQAALLHRPVQHQPRPSHRAASREPEFHSDPTRLAILELVPHHRYRYLAYYQPRAPSGLARCQRCPPFHPRREAPRPRRRPQVIRRAPSPQPEPSGVWPGPGTPEPVG